MYGHKENLKKILDKFGQDVKINRTMQDGNTALHLGIFDGHLPIVQILISKYGKDLNLTIRNNDGHNALDLAVIKKSNAITQERFISYLNLMLLWFCFGSREIRFDRD